MSKPNFYCENCDLTLTGSAPYTMHLAGKKHLKKLKSKGALAPQKGPQGLPDSTVADSNGRKMAEGYGGKFVSASSSGQGTTNQQPSNKGNFNNGTTQQGNYGYGNQYGVKGGGYVTYPNVTYTDSTTGQPWINPAPPVTGGQENSDPVMKAVRDNLLGKLPKKRSIAMAERCEICNVDYSSESNKQQHVAGKKHLKKAQLYEDGFNGKSFYCDFCKKDLNSPEQFKQHRIGAPHMKKVKAMTDPQLQTGNDGPSDAKRKYVPTTRISAIGPTEPKIEFVTSSQVTSVWTTEARKKFVPTTTRIAVSSM